MNLYIILPILLLLVVDGIYLRHYVKKDKMFSIRVLVLLLMFVIAYLTLFLLMGVMLSNTLI